MAGSPRISCRDHRQSCQLPPPHPTPLTCISGSCMAIFLLVSGSSSSMHFCSPSVASYIRGGRGGSIVVWWVECVHPPTHSAVWVELQGLPVGLGCPEGVLHGHVELAFPQVCLHCRMAGGTRHSHHSTFLGHDITAHQVFSDEVYQLAGGVTPQLTKAWLQPQALLTVLRQRTQMSPMHPTHAAAPPTDPPLPAGPDGTLPAWCSMRRGCCTAGHPPGCA